MVSLISTLGEVSIMKLSDLIRGNQVFLQVAYSGELHEFNSAVLASKEEGLLLSQVKVRGCGLRMPHEGVSLIFQVFNRLYIWRNILIDTISYRGRIFYRIKDVESDGKLYNRRGAYRLSLNTKYDIEIINGLNKMNSNCLIENISESGFCFVSGKDLPYNTKIRFEYGDDYNRFLMSAFIIRKVYNTENGLFSYGCKMPEFNEKLSKYIMQEQIRRIKTTA